MFKTRDRDNCAVFGIFAPEEDVARLTWYALFTMQHRGQESSGIFTARGEQTILYKQPGLVSEVFSERILNRMRGGRLALGHNRYSTAGSKEELTRDAQPFVVEDRVGHFFAVVHNGNIINAAELRQKISWIKPVSTSDTELFAILVAENEAPTWEKRLEAVLPQIRGAYSFVAATKGKLYGARDPHGFRPLILGKIGENGWVLSSETCALDIIGATVVRELEPGEVIVIDENGPRTLFWLGFQEGDEAHEAFCVFEFIYLTRPDSVIKGRLVHRVRKQMGARLYAEAPIEADVVLAVPNSGISAAIGFAEASGIPYDEGLYKNAYSVRTFIQPDTRLRRQGVALKFNPLRSALEGKRVVVVDDSIVRLTTMPRIVKLLREAGVAEVHVRIASAPIIAPCFMGVDTPTYKELAAAQHTVEEIAEIVGADSFAYLSYEGMVDCCGGCNLCTACFTGEYPINIEE